MRESLRRARLVAVATILLGAEIGTVVVIGAPAIERIYLTRQHRFEAHPGRIVSVVGDGGDTVNSETPGGTVRATYYVCDTHEVAEVHVKSARDYAPDEAVTVLVDRGDRAHVLLQGEGYLPWWWVWLAGLVFFAGLVVDWYGCRGLWRFRRVALVLARSSWREASAQCRLGKGDWRGNLVIAFSEPSGSRSTAVARHRSVTGPITPWPAEVAGAGPEIVVHPTETDVHILAAVLPATNVSHRRLAVLGQAQCGSELMPVRRGDRVDVATIGEFECALLQPTGSPVPLLARRVSDYIAQRKCPALFSQVTQA